MLTGMAVPSIMVDICIHLWLGIGSQKVFQYFRSTRVSSCWGIMVLLH
jgi:hypothetical protein